MNKYIAPELELVYFLPSKAVAAWDDGLGDMNNGDVTSIPDDNIDYGPTVPDVDDLD